MEAAGFLIGRSVLGVVIHASGRYQSHGSEEEKESSPSVPAFSSIAWVCHPPDNSRTPTLPADQQRERSSGTQPTARCIISPATYEFTIQRPYSISNAVVFTHTWPGAGNPTPQERWRSCGERAPPVVCEYQGIGNRLKERNVGREDSCPLYKLTMRDPGLLVKLSFCSETR